MCAPTGQPWFLETQTMSAVPLDDPLRTPRHPLGLPKGSVRALLALMVFGIIWTLLLIPERVDQEVHIPLYLYYLMFLILGHYFALRGHAPSRPGVREAHPLYLPRGSLRLLMFLGFAAALGWGYYHNPNFFDRLNPRVTEQRYLPVLILGMFFLGIVVNRIGHLLAGPEGVPSWFQDIIAWISLLAILALTVESILRLVIEPTLEKSQLDLKTWEGITASLVAFYFGARSGS
jgi:hypothetical protein